MEIAVIEKTKRLPTLPFVKREMLNPRFRFFACYLTFPSNFGILMVTPTGRKQRVERGIFD